MYTRSKLTMYWVNMTRVFLFWYRGLCVVSLPITTFHLFTSFHGNSHGHVNMSYIFPYTSIKHLCDQNGPPYFGWCLVKLVWHDAILSPRYPWILCGELTNRHPQPWSSLYLLASCHYSRCSLVHWGLYCHHLNSQDFTLIPLCLQTLPFTPGPQRMASKPPSPSKSLVCLIKPKALISAPAQIHKRKSTNPSTTQHDIPQYTDETHSIDGSWRLTPMAASPLYSMARSGFSRAEQSWSI